MPSVPDESVRGDPKRTGIPASRDDSHRLGASAPTKRLFAWKPRVVEARAAWILGLLLLLGAIADRRFAPTEIGMPACPSPTEAWGTADQTRGVDCAGGGDPLRGPVRVLYGLGIDPNLASAPTLEALPGVGPARAAAIVAAREEGPFRVTSDLLRVHGIGPATLARMDGWLAFSGDGQVVP